MGDTLHDALDFCVAVEPGAANLAAARARWRPQTGSSCGLLDRVARPHPGHPPDRRFPGSTAIAAASGSPSLAAAIADVQLTLTGLLAAILVIRRNLDHSDVQHTQHRRGDSRR